MIKTLLENEIEEHIQTLLKIDACFISTFNEVVDQIYNCVKNNKTIFWCGNGGSTSDSNHLSAELIGRYDKVRRPIKSISLPTNPSIATCISNDFGYDEIFARELEGLGSENDILVGISTSGKSQNVIKAMKIARKLNMKTIGLLGRDGGDIKKYCDHKLIVPSLSTARIQETHILLGHVICKILEEKLGF